MKNIRLFETNDDLLAAKDTLVTPGVSWTRETKSAGFYPKDTIYLLMANETAKVTINGKEYGYGTSKITYDGTLLIPRSGITFGGNVAIQCYLHKNPQYRKATVMDTEMVDENARSNSIVNSDPNAGSIFPNEFNEYMSTNYPDTDYSELDQLTLNNIASAIGCTINNYWTSTTERISVATFAMTQAMTMDLTFQGISPFYKYLIFV